MHLGFFNLSFYSVPQQLQVTDRIKDIELTIVADISGRGIDQGSGIAAITPYGSIRIVIAADHTIRFCGMPAKKQRIFSPMISRQRVRASTAAHAVCGVRQT